MAKSRDTWDVGKSYNDQIRRDIMQSLADELDLDELPMRDPGFNFFNAAVAFFAKHSNFKGADLYDAASDVLTKILSPTVTGKPAPVRDYIRFYNVQKNNGEVPQPFDRYFNMFISGRQGKGWTVLRDLSKKLKKRGLSLHGDEDDGGVGEAFEPVSHEQSPYDVLQFKEENPKKEKALAAVPDYLKDQRAGAAAEQMWEMLQEEEKTGAKLTLKEMAGTLDSMGLPGPTKFGDWDENAAYRLRRKVLEVVRQFMEGLGVDWESISMTASRKGFRFCARERY